MRVVLDTNVVVSALVFERGHLGWLRGEWTRGAVTPHIDASCTRELLRVLAYPKFRLNADEIQSLLGGYLPYAETVDTANADVGRLPRCNDVHDQKFLVLAQVSRAEVLVTGDRDLLALAGQTRFAIETPATLRKRLAT